MNIYIDWSGWDKVEESIVHCRCGAIYKSHNKSVKDGDTLRNISRRPCPVCGRNDNPRKIESPREKMEI